MHLHRLICTYCNDAVTTKRKIGMSKITYKAIDAKIADYNQAAIDASKIADEIIAKRTKQAAEHRSTQYSKVSILDGKDARASALTFLNRAVRDLSGNDVMKVASLSNALQSNTADKLNAGMHGALIGLDKLTRSAPDKIEFSNTAIAQKIEMKDNIKSSIRFLSKIEILKQVKDGKRVVGYAIADRDSLNGLLSLYK